MLHGASYVLQTAALENALDYETLVPFFVDVRYVDIPEEPLIKRAYKIPTFVRDFHLFLLTVSDT